MTETPGGTPNPHYSATLPERVEYLSPCTCGTVGFEELAAEVAEVAALVADGIPMRDACMRTWGTAA